MARAPIILFTAFEPSGDNHAAAMIAPLRRLAPHLEIHALGGPQMAAAGARLIATTTEQAAMLGSAVGKALEHRRLLEQLQRWLRSHRIAALVPTDSPAANWAICKLVRRHQPQARIVHLVMPQLWAWAPWRISKLRRLTDHVLCLLPFEPAWLEARGVAATFVGHPLFDPARSMTSGAGSLLPQTGTPKLALLPGSRRSEVRANWPTMLAACHELRRRHPQLTAVVAARDRPAAAFIRPSLAGSDAPQLATAAADDVLAWCDLALVKSGTTTLQVAAHRKPAVFLYNVNWWSWQLLGRWLIQTRTFTLPNLIGQSLGLGRVVPELVPHFGAVGPVVEEVDRLMRDPQARQAQMSAMHRIAAAFADRPFGDTAARQFLRVLDEGAPTNT